MAKFTDKFIQNLKPAGKILDIREGEGFGVRVLPSGVKTFFFIYRIDKKRRFLNLGHYDPGFETVGPDGKIIKSLAFHRIKYTEAKNKVAKGFDPLAELEQAALDRSRTPTISDFITEYIEQHAKKKNRSWKEIERALKANIVPKLGDRKITDIRRRDVVVLLDEIEKRAPVMANRTLAYTRKLFSFAVKRGVLEINPFLRMDAPAPENVGKRNLSFDEIKTLWLNLEVAKMSPAIRRALKLLLVTGQRPGEVIGIHSREIEGKWWTIPEERSKNKYAHRVFLTPLALELIGDKEGYIFESPADPGKDPEGNPLPPKPYEVRTMTHSIKKNLPHTPESTVVDCLKIPYFVPKDLRRTVASRMAEMGILEDTVDRVQNHVSHVKRGVRKNYNHYAYDREKQAALLDWERKLVSITTVKPAGKVLSMTRATGG